MKSAANTAMVQKRTILETEKKQLFRGKLGTRERVNFVASIVDAGEKLLSFRLTPTELNFFSATYPSIRHHPSITKINNHVVCANCIPPTN
jgi:hypothetical protein